MNIDFHEFVASFVNAVEAKDAYTAGHSDRVADTAYLISKEMGLDEETSFKIHIAAHLHDIGKIGIPDGILLKPGRLTNAEFEVMKSHSEIGYNIIKNNNGLKDIALMILHHHEKYDGNGYPNGLSGKDIPLGSRIIAVADAFDAMVTKRSYKDELSLQKAIIELINQSGKQFDPEIAEVFTKLISNKETYEQILKIDIAI